MEIVIQWITYILLVFFAGKLFHVHFSDVAILVREFRELFRGEVTPGAINAALLIILAFLVLVILSKDAIFLAVHKIFGLEDYSGSSPLILLVFIALSGFASVYMVKRQ